MSEKVLIVEDEKKIADLLADYFRAAHYQAHNMYDGRDVIEWLQSNPVDAVILDVMLPVKDGMQLCKEIRAFSQVPILMVTARVEEVDRLLGLELGADDYICKPFSPREVVARVKAVLRRTSNNHSSVSDKDGLVISHEKMQVTFNNQALQLTAVEFHLIDVMSQEPGRIFSRQQLMDKMYQDNRIVSDRTIDSHVKKLRQKLQSICSDKEFIHSVYGAGYRFEAV